MARSYFIETFGCQMNEHDSERMAGLLERQGYVPADHALAADVVVINTCSVREKGEDKLYSRLGELRDLTVGRREPLTIAVTGCVAQQEGAKLLSRTGSVDVVVGTQSLLSLPGLIDEAVRDRELGPAIAKARATSRVAVHPHDDVSFPLGVAKPSDPTRAWVTIIEGCNEFCAFCVVPYTRGHERMRPVSAIIADVQEAARTGHPEVQLLGQIVNHYHAPDDPSCDFAELLERVAAVPGIARVRFASPHPRHVSDRLIAAIRDIPQVCKHLHLPVQSGSNRMLSLMRRRYTREAYLDLIERMRQEVPGIALSTDMIVGFPTESDEDFDATLDLVRRARYHSMYSFKYSPRPNTLAIKRLPDDVPEAEKSRRIQILQALQGEIQTAWFEASVGTIEDVLVVGPSRRRPWELSGRTPGNTVVNFAGPADWIGRIVPVTITAAAPNSLRGVAVESMVETTAGDLHAD